MAVASAKASGLVVPRPFLKWAGGKGSLLTELMKRVEIAGDFGRYHEPFLGGGALFFHLYREGLLKRQAWLSDVNPRLMETWEAVAKCPSAVIAVLKQHSLSHDELHYYAVRNWSLVQKHMRAARMIYLNKTCFNGLYRENASGEFNVPIGSYENPSICDEVNLVAASKALQAKAKLFCGHFSDVLDRAKPGDFVYLDPPYVPITPTANLTTYSAGGFGIGQHYVLSYVFTRLHHRRVKVLMSNSNTDLVRLLYSDYTIEKVRGTRSLSCRGNGRGKVRDLLVRNF